MITKSCRFPTASALLCSLSLLSIPVLGLTAHAAQTDAASDSQSGSSVSSPAASSDGTSDSSGDNSSDGSGDAAAMSPTDAHVPISVDDDDAAGKFSATYFGIFYGPNISKPTSYQANSDGVPEANKPVMLKNFLGLGYNIADHIRVTPTAYWQWMPTSGGAYSIQDPFVTLSDDALFSTGEVNLYGDLRYYAPVSSWSQAADLTGSVQSVQVLTYVPQGSRFMFALYGSEREYFYGSQGYGDDLELYTGPNINYQLSPTVQLTMLYELNLCHVYGTDPNLIQNDGQDIEPGVSWDVSDNINIHPYLNFFPTNLSLQNTGVGMLLYWQAF